MKIKLTTVLLLAFTDFEKPFVADTDASSSAIEAVLAQKKADGNVHSVQYASRTMNSAEKNYLAFEREALAVMFKLKRLRLYLLSYHPFELRTSHQALQYALQKKDIQGKLACWLDLLTEYEFGIVYKSVQNNSAA